MIERVESVPLQVPEVEEEAETMAATCRRVVIWWLTSLGALALVLAVRLWMRV